MSISMVMWFGLMLTVSTAWVVWYLKRPLNDNGLDLQHSNIELGRQKKAELQNDLDQGLIDKEQFDQAQEEISNTLALELEQANITTANDTRISSWIWLVIVLLLPVLSIYMYQQLTTFSPVSKVAKIDLPPLSLEQSVVKIKQHLIDNPEDVEALAVLGMSYYELGQTKKSLQTYEKAYQLDPKNPRLLVEYASTIVSANKDQFTDQSVVLIKQALEIEPNSPDALYLAGMFAVSAQDFVLAKGLWNKALNALPEGSQDRQALISILDELKRVESGQVDHTITINVSISNEILAARSADDYLMVYVKAAKGRPMPIAIQKLKLKDFNGQIVLSDMNSVMPTKLLSQHGDVLVVARLSKTGSAMSQKDDLQVVSGVVSVTDNPEITLNLN